MSLDAIGIVSSDLNKSREFYKLLGVNLEQVGGPDHWEGRTPSGVRIMVDTVDLVKKLNPQWQKPIGSGVSLCFLQKDSQQVDEIFNGVVSAGYESIKEPWDAFWGQRYAMVKDPDGNQVDIFAPL